MKHLLIFLMGVATAASAGGGWQVHDPIRQGHLSVFPVTGETRAGAEKFITLDEGLGAGSVKVGELGSLAPRILRGPFPRPDSARVNELALVNNSDRPLLLLAGEIVSGGKQDRVVARDRIVPPHSAPVPLGVFCVEPGRWRGLSLEFATAKLMAHPKLRQETLVTGDQAKVWEEVASSRQAMAAVAPATRAGGVMGGTSYAGTAKASPVEMRVAEDSRAFLPKLPDDAVGMVVAVNGGVIWADVFPSAALFRRYRAKLLQSYVVESYGRPAADAKDVSVRQAREFLRSIGGRQNIEVEPGLYRLTRSEAEGLVTYELESLADNGGRLHFARMLR